MSRTLLLAFIMIAAFASTAFMPGENAADWSKVKTLHGRFAIAIVNYNSDPKERSSTTLVLDGFVAQGGLTTDPLNDSESSAGGL